MYLDNQTFLSASMEFVFYIIEAEMYSSVVNTSIKQIEKV